MFRMVPFTPVCTKTEAGWSTEKLGLFVSHVIGEFAIFATRTYFADKEKLSLDVIICKQRRSPAVRKL